MIVAFVYDLPLKLDRFMDMKPVIVTFCGTPIRISEILVYDRTSERSLCFYA